MTEKKTVRKKASPRKQPEKSGFNRLQDSAIGKPFEIANKVFLANLGLIAAIQSGVRERFDQYVKDGEVARDEYEASLTEFKERTYRKISDATDRVFG